MEAKVAGLEASVGAINAKVNAFNLKTNILTYAENLKTSGIHCIHARSVDETGVPGVEFSHANGIILRTDSGQGRITVLLFNRGDIGHGLVAAVNEKYGSNAWSGWRIISGNAI